MLSEAQWYQLLLKLTQVRGAEDPPKGDEEDKDDKGDDNSEEEEPPKDDDKPDVSGLKSALEKERKERKRLEKEARELKKFKDDKESENATETEKATKKAEAAEAKAAKLAARLRTQAIEMAISKYAGQMKFRDVNDALVQVARDESWITQDDDDPSEIEVDEKAVEKAVKDLADKKRYLLDAEGEQEPSGSKFGGGKKNGDEMDEAALRAKYPAMRQPALPST